MPIRYLKHLGRRIARRLMPVKAKTAAAVDAEHPRPQAKHSGEPKSREPRAHRDTVHSKHGAGAEGRHSTPIVRSSAAPAKHGAGAVRHSPVAPELPPIPDIPPEPGKVRFQDLNLPDELLRAVGELGFRYCMPIQARTLAYACEARSIAGRAQTGTGKTAAFLLMMYTRFLRTPRKGAVKPGAPRGLILAPTRELALQIEKDANGLAKYAGFNVLCLFGGAGFERQKRILETETVDVVVATPGRLLDFKGRGVLDLKHVEVLVIDEADRMLDMGFIPDVRRIVRGTPPKQDRQTLIFSATLTSDVMRLAEEWMTVPTIVDIEPEQVSAETIEEKVFMVTSHDKFALLYNLLQKPEFARVLVFGNRRVETERIADRLTAHGVRCALLSGDVPQAKRMSVLEEFRSGETRVLVATDVAGRGLHVEGVSHVINYDLPYEPQDYVHRIGRTGRAGAVGTAISFACENESFILPEIEKMTGEPLRCVMPEEALIAHPPPARREAGGASHARRPEHSRPRSGGGSSRPRSSGGRRPPFRSAR